MSEDKASENAFLLHGVFSFLTFEEAVACRKICKHFKYFFDQDYHWPKVVVIKPKCFFGGGDSKHNASILAFFAPTAPGSRVSLTARYHLSLPPTQTIPGTELALFRNHTNLTFMFNHAAKHPDFPNLGDFLSHFPSLTHVCLDFFFGCQTTSVSFPKLQTFKSSHGFNAEDTFLDFLQKCPALENVSVETQPAIAGKLLSVLAEHCPKIQSVTLSEQDSHQNKVKLDELGVTCWPASLQVLEMPNSHIELKGPELQQILTSSCPTLREIACRQFSFQKSFVPPNPHDMFVLRQLDHSVSFKIEFKPSPGIPTAHIHGRPEHVKDFMWNPASLPFTAHYSHVCIADTVFKLGQYRNLLENSKMFIYDFLVHAFGRRSPYCLIWLELLVEMGLQNRLPLRFNPDMAKQLNLWQLENTHIEWQQDDQLMVWNKFLELNLPLFKKGRMLGEYADCLPEDLIKKL